MTLTYSNQPRRQNFAPIIHRLAGHIRDISTEACNRLTLKKELGALDAYRLRDIGLTESDVISAGFYPLSRDAADYLTQLARARSSNW